MSVFGFLFDVGIYAGRAFAGAPRTANAMRVDSPRAAKLVHMFYPFELVEQRQARPLLDYFVALAD